MWNEEASIGSCCECLLLLCSPAGYHKKWQVSEWRLKQFQLTKGPCSLYSLSWRLEQQQPSLPNKSVSFVIDHSWNVSLGLLPVCPSHLTWRFSSSPSSPTLSSKLGNSWWWLWWCPWWFRSNSLPVISFSFFFFSLFLSPDIHVGVFECVCVSLCVC